MGAYLSLQQDPRPTEPVFMVPSYYSFTPAQLQIMTDAGLQPGVPFRISSDGAHRNEGTKVRAGVIDNTVTLSRKSIKLTETDDSFHISFTYSASVPAKLHIFFNVLDVSIPNQLRIERSSVDWGPIPLSQGLHVEFDSAQTSYSISKSEFLASLQTRDPEQLNYIDMVIVMAPLPQAASPIPAPSDSTPAPPKLRVMGEFSCFRIIGGELNKDDTNTRSPMKLKYISQRLQLPTKVFYVQEVFGMDTSASPEGAEGEGPDRATEGVTTGEGGAEEEEATPLTPGATSGGLDADSSECVICLSDPREVNTHKTPLLIVYRGPCTLR